MEFPHEFAIPGCVERRGVLGVSWGGRAGRQRAGWGSRGRTVVVKCQPKGMGWQTHLGPAVSG